MIINDIQSFKNLVNALRVYDISAFLHGLYGYYNGHSFHRCLESRFQFLLSCQDNFPLTRNDRLVYKLKVTKPSSKDVSRTSDYKSF